VYGTVDIKCGADIFQEKKPVVLLISLVRSGNRDRRTVITNNEKSVEKS
jgi:hypothetical protein